jgi:tRNA pseudouridine38-40 synthase
LSRTLKLTLAYDGTAYVGWQRQATGVSIQGLVEGALSRLERAAVSLVVAGRTDAGVHAFGQVASATVATALDAVTIRRALNATLPPDVRVLLVEDVPQDFHARRDARSKIYQYRVRTGELIMPFERHWWWHLTHPPDVAAMQAASAALVGTHDFAAFQSTGSSVKTSTRTVIRAEWHAVAHGADRAGPPATIVRPSPDGEAFIFEIEADGFLRHMVRSIVGTLVDIGEGRRGIASIGELLTSRDRGLAGPTAPAHGLFLVGVRYPE